MDEKVLESLMEGINAIGDKMSNIEKSNSENMQKLEKKLDEVEKKAEEKVELQRKSRPSFDPSEGQSPYITSGPVGKDGQGYSFVRLIGAMREKNWKKAKFEYGVSEELHNKGYGTNTSNILVPSDGYELEQVIPGITSDLSKTMGISRPRYNKNIRNSINKAAGLSRDTTTEGGYLVNEEFAPQIVDILSAKSIMGRFGATQMSLPKSGKFTFHKGDGGATGYWVGDVTAITESKPSFDQTSLDAEKNAALIKISNSLLSDATPSMERYLRNEIARTLANTESSALLDGTNASNRPASIADIAGTYTGLTAVTAASTGAAGDTLTAADLFNMLEQCDLAEAEFEGWIMRPELWSQILQFQAKNVAGTENVGGYSFDSGRALADRINKTLLGYPVLTSSHVAINRVKGAGSDLTYLMGGQFSDVVVGRQDVLEISTTDSGDTAFSNDETWFRGIQRVDWTILREASICMMDDLLR